MNFLFLMLKLEHYLNFLWLGYIVWFSFGDSKRDIKNMCCGKGSMSQG